MAIKHAKNSAKTDGADAGLVQPSDWNTDHNIGVSFVLGTYTQRLTVPAAATITLPELADVVSTLIKTLSPVGAFDADAQTFFTNAGITDANQKSAVNQLVVDLKLAGAWTKLKAIYPFVGGTAAQHSYNLKNTTLHQMIWNGTVTHNAFGVTGNGTTGYGNTNYNQSLHGILDSEYFALYSRNNTLENKCDIGVMDVNYNGTYTVIQNGNGGYEIRSQANGAVSGTTTTSAGFFSVNRNLSASFDYNRNGNRITLAHARNVALNNANFYFMAWNRGGIAELFTSRNYAFAAIGPALTTAEDDAVRTAVLAFQTTLARNV